MAVNVVDVALLISQGLGLALAECCSQWRSWSTWQNVLVERNVGGGFQCLCHCYCRFM